MECTTFGGSFIDALTTVTEENKLFLRTVKDRYMNFQRRYPSGYIEVVGGPYEVYDYCTLPYGRKIVYQIIRSCTDNQNCEFMRGLYDERLEFFIADKVWRWFPTIERWRLKLKRWEISNQIPIEMMEEAFDKPFREMWMENDRIRHEKIREFEDIEELRYKSGFYAI